MNSPAGRMERFRGWTLLSALLLTPLALSYQTLTFDHPKLLVIAAALLVLAVLGALSNRVPTEGFRAFAPAWGLLAWGCLVHVVALQTAVPAYAIQALLYGALLLATGAYALELMRAEDFRERMRTTILVSALLVAVLALLQYAGAANWLFPIFEGYDQRAYSVFGNQDLLGAYAALGFVLALHALAVTRRPWLPSIAVLILMAALFVSGSRSAWAAAVVGALVSVASKPLPAKRLFPIVAAAALMLVVWTGWLPRVGETFGAEDTGWRARLLFWNAGVRMAADYWLLGVGPGNFVFWSPTYQGLAFAYPVGGFHFSNTILTVYAHSDPLEIFAETGVVGALFAVWMLARLVARGRGPEWGGVATLLAFSLVNPLMTSPAHALAGVVLAAGLLSERYGVVAASKPQDRRIEAWGMSAAAACLLLFVVLAQVWPGHLVRRAESSGNESMWEAVVDYPWPQYAGYEEYGDYLMSQERHEAALVQYHRALRGRDTGHTQLMAGYAAEMTDRSDLAERHFRAAVWRWPYDARARQGVAPYLTDAEQEAAANAWRPQ